MESNLATGCRTTSSCRTVDDSCHFTPSSVVLGCLSLCLALCLIIGCQTCFFLLQGLLSCLFVMLSLNTEFKHCCLNTCIPANFGCCRCMHIDLFTPFIPACFLVTTRFLALLHKASTFAEWIWCGGPLTWRYVRQSVSWRHQSS